MAEAKTDQEPSIEEILESIRQIISEDGDAPAAGAAAPAAPPVMADKGIDLDLRPDDTPPPPPPAPPAQAAATEQDDDILDLTEKAVPANPPQIVMTDPEPAPPAGNYEYTPPPQDTGAGDVTGDALVSDMTADISAHAMARLLSGNVSVEREMTGRPGPVTLEDMTRELLRPLLKNWLDQNLPAIIERQVAKEIEKISRLAMKQ